MSEIGVDMFNIDPALRDEEGSVLARRNEGLSSTAKSWYIRKRQILAVITLVLKFETETK